MKVSIFLLMTLFVVYAAGTSSKAPHHISKHVAEDAAHSKQAKNLEHGAHKKAGKESKHHFEAGHKGQHGSTAHKVADEEKGGKKTSSKSKITHSSHKKAAGHQEHGAKFAEGAKHKKTNTAKGYHERYHKNERRQHDSFYSHGKKSGDWKTYGLKHSKHASDKYDKVEHKNKLALKSSGASGKAKQTGSGHNVEDHKSHKADKSSKHHYEKQIKFGKKHQKPEDKHKYKYSQVLH